ncbi:stalled ribosome sensor GCN1 [Phlebotomus argentipes]|uniref:stalled ribosome sensor GCN1 n=1 Tax=Phlebotomus argentipes TaxID=94469 RepID=UPI002892B1AD|nr:stalled ribosome sensor GCN1 [Phlebotomus argentipes]
MADSELAKALKDLPNRVINVGVEERKPLIDNVITILSNPGINTTVVKGICRVIGTTLTKYRDPPSQALIRSLIVALVQQHNDWTLEHFNGVFKTLLTKDLAAAPAIKASQAAVIALTWSNLLAIHRNVDSDVTQKEFPKLVEHQSQLYQLALSVGNPKLSQKAYELFETCWQRDDLVVEYFELLAKMEAAPNVILLIAAAICFCESNRPEEDLLTRHKAKVLEHFIKGLISVKTKPNVHYFTLCQTILQSITKEEFQTLILPALQRAMLRSPEIILQGVGAIVKEVDVDMSDFAMDMGKTLIQNLYSKNDVTRQEAADSLKYLSEKCENAETIEKLLKHIFGVWNGSDGKITVVEYRINVLQGVGNLSFNSLLPESMDAILSVVMENFIRILESETHEKILCHSLEMFSLWASNFEGQLPDKIIPLFRKGIEGKSATQNVRISYMDWLLACLQGGTLTNGKDLVPFLLKTVEKAAQNPTQIPTVTEGLCASCLILLLEEQLDDEALAKLSVFWSIILDLNKQVFVAERFISSVPGDTLKHVMLLIERLLLCHFDRLKGNPEVLYKAAVYCMTVSSPNVRIYCQSLTRKIATSENGVIFTIEFLAKLTNYMENAKIHQESDAGEDGSVPVTAFIDTIETLCTIEDLQPIDAEKIALNSLLCCHHSALISAKSNLWESILKAIGVDPKTLINLHSGKIFEILLTNYCITSMYENSVSTVSRVNPDILLPHVMELVSSQLGSEAMSNVTDDEYFTFLTPEGELYDKSVIPNADDIYQVSGMKRENKVYSYKEQMEELQLRREIEEKRRKEGKAKPVQLTPKQKEAIKNQTDKENAIRARLADVNEKLLKLISMIESVSRGNPEQLATHFSCLLPIVLAQLKNPLAAPLLIKLYNSLRMSCFQDSQQNLRDTLAITTIRLYEPHCDLPAEWLTEPVTDSVTNVLMDLFAFTADRVSNETANGEAEEEDVEKGILTGPAFCYAFEFLKKCMNMTPVSKDENLLLCGIQIISHHAQTRGMTDRGASTDYRHPKYLPRLEMLRLLLGIISSNRGRVQTQAVAALLDVAEATSGREYCALPTKAELELLLQAIESNLESIRDVALRALLILVKTFPSFKNDSDLHRHLICRLWIAKHDISDDNRELAENLWTDSSFILPNDMTMNLMSDVIHPESCIQKATASCLVSILMEDSSPLQKILDQLLSIYNDKLAMIPPKLDQFDREIEPAIDQWRPRRGVAFALTEISQFFDEKQVFSTIQFMVSKGLGDRDEMVHKEMLAASLAIVDKHGKDTIARLLPVFEEFLDKAPNSSRYDNIRQAVVILMGSLARHLEVNDERIQPIVKRLLAALATPSETVQEAVASCLPYLIPSVKDEAQQMIKKLLHQLIKSDKYGERRGAAYGIAGIVKGLGIISLKQLDIMTKLTNYIQDKKNYKSREGALFAFEMLCKTLGRLFEPYIVHVLPFLLQCFGDSSQYVRQSADDTAKVVMGKLSAYGVKLVLPALLNALDEDSWRTKTASVELLGAMAYCAPKQLSSCLPSIVPKLIEVLSDSHSKVQEAGADALRVIGSVIKNPEIQAIVPVLLRALEDPANKTSACLQSLLETKFVHFIDAPSLALIMPVVQRAFIMRSPETRKMAAKIIGNMYSLTDQKDLTPYLPNIIPGLKMSLLDPVPEVRAVSARALGAMVRGMGESSFEDLLPWLMQTLTSESSSVDRSGAAQGLSEVVGGLGVEKLHKLMPEIISTAERNDIAPHVKDGYIMMFIYMPAAFPNEFTPYIGQIINPILKALADENEYVRETALKAGQRIVNMYAESAIALLLPELEKGLFDDNWRIRFSSVQLLGDLLYRISGVSGKMTTETASEDDNFGTEQSHTAIIRSLGAERRNRVLAGLYMGRSDVSLMVRQAALHVWKVVVTNTPRTLREILPTLFGLLLGCLASTSFDKRQVAARTLGDLVRKLGERVLPEIIPILERGLNSEQADQRQGVCIGLSEIMASTSKDMVLTFVNSLVPTVRRALSDPVVEVRMSAAKTFDSLHTTVGNRALDDILPSMLNGLSDPDPVVVECTLDGLRQVMAIKSRVVLPYLVPQLTATPVNTKALSILASVAGEALTKFLPKILPALLTALSSAQGQSHETQELEYCQAVILSVSDEVGVRTVMDTLMLSTKSNQADVRRAAATLLCAFCTHSPGDYSQYVPQLLRGLMQLLADTDRDVLQRSWEALNAVTKTLDSAQQIAHVSDVRQAVRFAASDLKGEELPGFCLPKGITPLLPVFREAILNGLPEEKENAAQGLGEVISLTSATSLQPSVVHITGPLIRILGDRFNAGVKASVLETLAILLRKVGVMLKQFLPQLQTTFLKALHDPNRMVRIKAGQALAQLVMIHTRADPLFTEMHTGIKGNDDSAVRETMLQALRGITSPAGDKMTEPLRKQVYGTLVSMLNFPEDVSRSAVGGCLGALCKWLSPEQLDDALVGHVLNEDHSEDWVLRHGRTSALFVVLKEAPDVVYVPKYEAKICKVIVNCITSDKTPVACNAVRSAGYLLQHCMNAGKSLPPALMGPFVRAMNHNSNEVKQLLANTCNYLAKVVPAENTPPEFLRPVIPMLVNGTKEKNGYVKSNSEIALIAMLRLRTGEETHQKCMSLLEVGARESLSEVVTKVLRKVALQPVGKEEDLDDTILS